MPILEPFAPLMWTEADFILNRHHIIQLLSDTLYDQDWPRAAASLDLIVGLKGDGLRRDGMPAILHEVSQALYTFGLVDAKLLKAEDPLVEQLLCLNFTHDIAEDFGERQCGAGRDLKEGKNLYMRWLQNQWAKRTGTDEDHQDLAELSWRMAKKYGRHPFPGDQSYYWSLGRHPATVIGKCEDRVHNLATLIGSHSTKEDMARYCRETRDDFTALLNGARTDFPAYVPVFQFFQELLSREVRLIERLNDSNEVYKGIGDLFAINDSMAIPPGVNPISMIVLRDERRRQQLAAPAPDRAPENPVVCAV